MNIKDFYNLCADFDPFYDFTDDYSVWRKYDDMFRLIQSVRADHPEFAALFSAWCDYWQEPKRTKPPSRIDFGAV